MIRYIHGILIALGLTLAFAGPAAAEPSPALMSRCNGGDMNVCVSVAEQFRAEGQLIKAQVLYQMLCKRGHSPACSGASSVKQQRAAAPPKPRGNAGQPYGIDPSKDLDRGEYERYAQELPNSPTVRRLAQWAGRKPTDIIAGQDFFQAAGVSRTDISLSMTHAGVDPRLASWGRMRMKFVDSSPPPSFRIFVGFCSTRHSWCGGEDDTSIEGALYIQAWRRDEASREQLERRLWVINTDIPEGQIGMRYCRVIGPSFRCFLPDPALTDSKRNMIMRLNSENDIANVGYWMEQYGEYAENKGQWEREYTAQREALTAALQRMDAASRSNRAQYACEKEYGQGPRGPECR